MKHAGQQQQEIGGVFTLDGGVARHKDTKRRQKLTGAPMGERGEGFPGMEEAAKGCGKQTHVAGTNGGLMPCGGLLTGLDGTAAPYLCGSCDPLFNPPTREELTESGEASFTEGRV